MKTKEPLARPKLGPKDPNGIYLAALAALLVLMIPLSFETQLFASLAGYDQRELGAPLVGTYYPPYASLVWMVKYDLRYRPLGPIVAGPPRADGTPGPMVPSSGGFTINPYESLWAREAFANERLRLAFECFAVFVLFSYLSGAWSKEKPNTGVHGKAAWASAADIRKSGMTRATVGVILGQDPKTKKLLVHEGPQNVIAIGPPGVGKSDGIAIPTLKKTWPSSAIVFDPAGELADTTADARRRNTRVLIFDPRNPNSARYNPLVGMGPYDIDAIETVISAYILDKDPLEMQENSRFFITSAIEVAVALVARTLEIGGTNLGTAANYYYAGGWEDDAEFAESLTRSEVPYVANTGSKLTRMHNELRSSIIGTLTQYLAVFRSNDIANATSASDFTAQMLRARPTTLYLIVREKDQTQLNPLLRMLMTRLLDDLTERIPKEGEQSVLLMVDEFPLLRAPVFQRKLATFRKYRILPVLLAQAVTQIKDYYGQNESITGLCDVRVFFPTLDLPTQEMASATCGDTTIWTQSISRDGQKKTSTTTQESGRRLLLPSDLGSLRERLVIAKKLDQPILAEPVRAWKDPRFKSPQPAAPFKDPPIGRA
ncbi:MAG TPA: type IV secretory system conjugative DNA transfer family protein [Candidatus Baltobacteraceae bacterium]|jgi:type IV secretion system protein VirD4|nr:type IV secretory system conjugative DNA transfer family protein [Candidatus Baltobacteraceae bacterium]